MVLAFGAFIFLAVRPAGGTHEEVAKEDCHGRQASAVDGGTLDGPVCGTTQTATDQRLPLYGVGTAAVEVPVPDPPPCERELEVLHPLGEGWERWFIQENAVKIVSFCRISQPDLLECWTYMLSFDGSKWIVVKVWRTIMDVSNPDNPTTMPHKMMVSPTNPTGWSFGFPETGRTWGTW